VWFALTRAKRPKSNVSAPGIWRPTVVKVGKSFNAKKKIRSGKKNGGVVVVSLWTR
jgi:hypothetical protein